ncbi:MAG TPA: hypothetical protein VE650_17485 [Acetobacteraceae bacterium]|nr:hypothetical protein [Acetobacteraceae bacterium]
MTLKLLALLIGCMVAVSLALKGFTDFGENGLTVGEWVGSIILAAVFGFAAWWTALHAMRWCVRKGYLPGEDDW